MNPMLEIVLIFAAFLVVYLFPWIVARCNNRRQSDAILVANILFGWTLLGWGGALVWAIMEDKR